MILHRLVDSLRNQDWTTVVVEVGIVVLGVFLGIEVANWNEDRQNQARAESYMVRLEADLDAQLAMWENAYAYFEQTRKHAQDGLDALVGPADALGQPFLIDLYQASQERELTGRRATYEELVANGGIEYLNNPVLREALSAHYDVSTRWLNVIDNASGYRPILRQLMDHRIQAAIVAGCGDVYVQTRFGIVGMRLPESCSVDLPADLVAAEIERLHGNEEILRHLRFQAATLRTRLAAIETAIEGSRNTLAAVRQVRGEGP